MNITIALYNYLQMVDQATTKASKVDLSNDDLIGTWDTLCNHIHNITKQCKRLWLFYVVKHTLVKG